MASVSDKKLKLNNYSKIPTIPKTMANEINRIIIDGLIVKRNPNTTVSRPIGICSVKSKYKPLIKVKIPKQK